MSALLSCPFCGGGPGLAPHGYGGVRIAMSRYLTGKWAARPACENCGVIGMEHQDDSPDEARKKATEAWNTRAPSSPRVDDCTLGKLQGFATRLRPHHVLYCNASREKPVGCEMCICLREEADEYYPIPRVEVSEEMVRAARLAFADAHGDDNSGPQQWMVAAIRAALRTGEKKPEPVDLTIRPEDLAAALAAPQNPCTHYTAQMERDCPVCQKWRDEHPGAMP